MNRRIIVVLLSIVWISYTFFMGYILVSNSTKLKPIVGEKNQMVDKIVYLSKELENNENKVNELIKQKDNLEITLVNKQAELNRLNTSIAAKEKEIMARNAKNNASNGTGDKTAYLTFDDGPSKYTSKVLDVLKEYGIKATFFVKGRDDEYSLSIYKRIVNEGHTIGNHTYSHSYAQVYASTSAYDDSFNQLQNLIKNTTGVTMDIMRFPGGSNNNVSESYSKGIMDVLTKRYRNLGYQYFDWNVSAGDGASSGVTNSTVTSSVLTGCGNKNTVTILMHDSLATTSDTIENIIIALSNKGYKFAALNKNSGAIHFK